MTAIVIGLLSVSAGAVFSVGFGALIVGDVLMAFGVFIGIKGLLVTLIETLRADPTSEVATLPRPAGRPGAYPAPPRPMPCRCAVLRGCRRNRAGAMRLSVALPIMLSAPVPTLMPPVAAPWRRRNLRNPDGWTGKNDSGNDRPQGGAPFGCTDDGLDRPTLPVLPPPDDAPRDALHRDGDSPRRGAR